MMDMAMMNDQQVKTHIPKKLVQKGLLLQHKVAAIDMIRRLQLYHKIN